MRRLGLSTGPPEAVLASRRAVGHGAAELLSLAGEHDARPGVVLSAVTVESPPGRLASPAPSRRPRTSSRGCSLDWTILRCADFAASALAWVPQIRQAGVVRGAYGDAAISSIRTRKTSAAC